MFKLANSFYQHVMPGVVKPLHVLWNEVIGFVFVVLAVATGSSAWRYYRAIEVDPNNVFRLGLTIAFATTMAWFGVSSFLKARKIRRKA
jgi:tryptophan-rich sensory protein